MIEARLVYLAGPIYEQDDTCIRWRKAAQKILRTKNIMSIAPTDVDYRGYERREQTANEIVKRDKRWIIDCDTVLAKCDFPSYGTAMEIMFAWSLQKQIIVVTNSHSPWIRYHACRVFPTVEEALENMQFPDFDPALKQ
jgi:nucleoside 2-deoxyribosyltransferase